MNCDILNPCSISCTVPDFLEVNINLLRLQLSTEAMKQMLIMGTKHLFHLFLTPGTSRELNNYCI